MAQNDPNEFRQEYSERRVQHTTWFCVKQKKKGPVYLVHPLLGITVASLQLQKKWNFTIVLSSSVRPPFPPSLRHPASVILPPSSSLPHPPSLPASLPPLTHSLIIIYIYIYLFIYMAYMANHHHHHHHHHPLSFSTLTVRRWRGPPAILAGPPAPKGLQPNLDPSKRAKVES